MPTPGVNIVAEEVNAAVRRSAVDIIGQWCSNGGIVISSISHTDGPISPSLDVCLHISSSSLDEWNGPDVGGIVGDLVPRKESEDIVEGSQCVDDAGIASEELSIPGWLVSIDGGVGGRQIGNDVDAGVLKHLHALFVVFRWVDGIYSDGICLELLEVGDVSFASVDVGQRVDVVDICTCGSITSHVFCKL